MGRGRAELVVALNELRRGGARAVLAIAAVAVGIAAMTSVLALGAGARAALDGAAAGAGREVLTIVSGRVDAPPGRGVASFASTRLDVGDVVALRADLDGRRLVAPIAERPLRVKLGNRAAVTSVRGVTPEYFTVRGLVAARGRLPDELDGAVFARVAVVGAFVAAKLDGQVLGESVSIGGVPFTVVGELEQSGIAADGTNLDDQILVPLPTAERRLFKAPFLSAVLIELIGREERARVAAVVRAMLRRNHALDVAARDDFEILAAIGTEQTRRAQEAFVERLLRPFAIIAVAIGGAVVLVITYLNVLDRTAEIGLRMAIGARRRDIARQFVLEATCSSVLGGSLGAIVVSLGALAVRATLGWTMAVDGNVLLWPLVAATVLGVGCSAGPALLAARVPPLEALSRG